MRALIGDFGRMGERRLLIAGFLVFAMSGCVKSGQGAPNVAVDPQKAASQLDSHQVDSPLKGSSSTPVPAFDSTRAWRYTKEVVAFGPRPIGSANHRKLEDYIHAHLKGDVVEDDAFTIDTTEGSFPVRNIIAKYPAAGAME